MNCECGCGQEIPAKHLFRYKPPYLLRGHRLETPLCACGCGERIEWSPNLRYQTRVGFLKGHHTRKNAQPKPCACGCGQLTTVWHGATREFVSGHNARGRIYVPSEETKAKIRKARERQPRSQNGMSTTPTYRSWISMNWRCRDPRDASYPNYGGRGIAVCERWNQSSPGGFMNFLADMGERPEGRTLDRLDGNGNYEPGNCRWATKAEQTANRRDWWPQRRANQHV